MKFSSHQSQIHSPPVSVSTEATAPVFAFMIDPFEGKMRE